MSKKRKKSRKRKKRTKQASKHNKRVSSRSKPETFKVVYFFIPLRIPLHIPDGQIIRFTSPTHPFEEEDECIGREWDEELNDVVDIINSIRIHQLQYKKFDTYIEAAIQAAENAFPSDSISNNNETGMNPSFDGSEITITVIEAVARLTGTLDGLEDINEGITEHSEAIEQAMTRAFDQALDKIRALQRSYAIVTKHLVPLISLAEMPMGIPYAIRTVEFNETKPVWPKISGLFLTNFTNSYIEQLSFNYVDINTELIDDIVHIGDMVNTGPFSEFMDNWREARLAVRNRSNSIACILASTACELCLRKVLLLILWEEGVEPKQAARLLCGSAPYSRSISNLISREFHHRLGGSWNLQDDGLIAQIYQNVFQLRNRVVHGGYVPDNSEAKKSVDSCRELYDLIVQRFESKIDQYPLIASMIIPNSRIKNSDLFARLEHLLSKQTIPESPFNNCMSYQFEVERYMQNRDLRNGAALSGELEGANVALLAFPTGKIQWWLADPINRVACLAKRPKLTRQQMSTVIEIRRRAKRENVLDSGAFSVLMRGTRTVPLEYTPVWYPTYKVWPLCRADRFPACPIPIHIP